MIYDYLHGNNYKSLYVSRVGGSISNFVLKEVELLLFIFTSEKAKKDAYLVYDKVYEIWSRSPTKIDIDIINIESVFGISELELNVCFKQAKFTGYDRNFQIEILKT